MNITVDRVACEGHALCLTYAPELFDIDDEERAVVLVDPVPPELARSAEDAVVNCPVQALRLASR